MKKFLQIAVIAVMAICVFPKKSSALDPFMPYMNKERSSYNLDQVKEVCTTKELSSVPLNIDLYQFKVSACETYNNQKNSQPYGGNYDDMTPEDFNDFIPYFHLRPAKGKMRLHGLKSDGTIGTITRDPYPGEMIVYVSPNEIADDLDQIYPGIDLFSAACFNTFDVPFTEPPAPRDEGGGTSYTDADTDYSGSSSESGSVTADASATAYAEGGDQYVTNNYYSTTIAEQGYSSPQCGYSAPQSACYDPYYGSSDFRLSASLSLDYSTGCGGNYSGPQWAAAQPITNIYNDYSVSDSYNDNSYHDNSYHDNSYTDNSYLDNSDHSIWYTNQQWTNTTTNTTNTTTTTTNTSTTTTNPTTGHVGWENPGTTWGGTPTSTGWPKNPPPGDGSGGMTTGNGTGGTGTGTGGTGTADPLDPGDGTGVIWGGKMVKPNTGSTQTQTASLSRKASPKSGASAMNADEQVLSIAANRKAGAQSQPANSQQEVKQDRARPIASTAGLSRKVSTEKNTATVSSGRGYQNPNQENLASADRPAKTDRAQNRNSEIRNDNAQLGKSRSKIQNNPSERNTTVDHPSVNIPSKGNMRPEARVNTPKQFVEQKRQQNTEPQNRKQQEMKQFVEPKQRPEQQQRNIQKPAQPSFTPNPGSTTELAYNRGPSVNRSATPAVNRNIGSPAGNRNSGGGRQRSRQ